MTLELLIERWLAAGMLVMGLSHMLHPAKCAALFLPLRERDTGGLLMAMFTLPLGLFIVFAHNVWVWGLPVIVTLLGWAMTVKSVIYLLFPGAHRAAMPAGERLKRGFFGAGLVLLLLGGLIFYGTVR
jgi:hypothetical protein